MSESSWLDILAELLRVLAKTLKMGEYYIADWLFLTMLLTAVLCLYRGHRAGVVDLWDVIRTTKGDKVFTDARKLFEAGAFVVMTVGFAHMTIQGKLTEWYAMVFVGAWVVARGLRDREQRLNRKIEMEVTHKPAEEDPQ